VHLSQLLRTQPAEQLLDRATKTWDGYHTRAVTRQDGNDVVAEDPSILLYYQNRMLDYAEAIAGEEDLAAAREIAVMGVEA
jgi:glycerol-3-phosphate O-acyltransferase